MIIFLGGSYLQLATGAIIGGLATAACVYLLAWRRGVQGFRLIIVGIAVSAVLSLSFNTWLLLTAQLEVAISAAIWGAGSLSGIGWEQTIFASIIIIALLAGLSLFAPGLRQLELGDDGAKATGDSCRTRQIKCHDS